MKNLQTQPPLSDSLQALTRQALKEHFRKEMMVFGLILAVMTALIALYFMPGSL